MNTNKSYQFLKWGVFLQLSLILLLFLNTTSSAQSTFNYRPKALENELKKYSEKITHTLQEIEALNQVGNEGKYFRIAPSEKTNYNIVYIGRVNGCRAGGCSPSSHSTNTESEYFDYFILFDNSGAVKHVNVYNYQASHGQEVTAKGWLSQFIGYNGKEQLVVGKTIDAISGATTSTNNLTDDIQMRVQTLKNWLER